MNPHDSENWQNDQQQSVDEVQVQGDDNIFNVIQGQVITLNQTRIIQIAADKIKTQPLVMTSPYKGLRKFEPEDKDRFFGRDQFLTELVNQLEQTNLILLLGASGSGKSSVVRAGLIPWLSRKFGNQLVALSFTPDQDPFESLYISLRQHYRQAQVAFVREAAVDTWIGLMQLKSESHWFILIDQFEELFTVSRPQQRDCFINSLLQLNDALHQTSNGSVKILATMRADFLDRLSPYPKLVKATDLHRPFIAEMQQDELRLAIEQPAAQHGVVFESGLADEIIRDVQGQAGYLPLLQYSLDLLWNAELKATQFNDRTLKRETYRRLGGVRGALQQHVDQVYSSLLQPEQLAAKQIFLKLVEVSREASSTDWKPVRRRALWSEFADPTEQQVLFTLINENLLVSSFSSDKIGTNTANVEQTRASRPTVEIAHEVLLTSWPQLTNWIQENQQAIVDRSRIYKDLQEWQITRSDDDLLRGSILERAIELRKDAAFNQVLGGFDQTTNHFINASASLQDRQRRRRDRQRRRIVIGLTLASFLITAFAVFAGRQWINAEKQVILATSTYSGMLSSSDQGFNALIASLKAGLALQRMPWLTPKFDVESKVLMALGDSLYGVREFNTLEGHTGGVYGVSFSPDGQTLASAGEDGTIKLWNQQGKLLKTLSVPGGTIVYGVSFSPDGEILASANADGTVGLWDRDGTLTKTLRGHGGAVYHVSFSADGETLASSSADKTIKLWRPNGELLKTLTGHTDAVRDISFSSDGQILASASADKTLKLWRPDGTLLKTVTDYNRPVLSVNFSPDDQTIVATSEDGTIRFWSQSGEERQRLFLGGTVYRAIFSPDGQTIASGGGDTVVQLWSSYFTLIQTFMGNTEGILNLAFSPDGQTLAASSEDGLIKLWRRNMLWTQTLQGHAGEVNWATFSPNGQTLASVSADKTIKLWNRSGELRQTLSGHTDVIHGLSFSPDGQTIASASWDKTIKLWRVTDGQLLKTLSGHTGRVYGISFSPNPSKAMIASSSNDGTIKLWNPDGRMLKTLSGHTDVIHNLSFSPDGQTLVSSSHDKTIKLWRVGDGKLLKTLRGHTNWVHQVKFSPDGQLIVSASHDRTAKLWRVADGKLLKTFMGHTDKAAGISFSPDGQTIASSSEDKTIRLWKLDGTLAMTLRGHGGRVHGVDFSPDGTTLASASYDSTVILWDLQNRDNLDALRTQGCDWAGDYLKNNATLNQTLKVGSAQELRRLCK
jgi:WD40 repeat protein/energy-coupling factor transporter ATP-binding protein EcfA2